MGRQVAPPRFTAVPVRVVGGAHVVSLFGALLQRSGAPTTAALWMGAAFAGGLWFGGAAPVVYHRWIPSAHRATLRREWTFAALGSGGMVLATGNACDVPPLVLLCSFLPCLTLAYAAGKAGCVWFGCCDWSARYFTPRVRLPALEASIASVLGVAGIVGLLIRGPSECVAATTCLCYSCLRMLALAARGESLRVWESHKVDGQIFFAAGLGFAVAAARHPLTGLSS